VASSEAAESAPLVSVVIASYNGERFLAEAIRSVLGQTHSPVELIVVDDASQDSSLELARSFEGVEVLARSVNGGVAVARNDGLAVAAGEYFAYTDQDDLMVPDRLRSQLEFLLRNPGFDAVVGTEEVFVEDDGDPDTGLTTSRIPDEHGGFEVGGYFPPTLLARTEDLRRIGGFDTTIDFGDDLDLLLRMREDPALRVALLDEVAVRRRFHADNQMRDKLRAKRAFALTVKRRIERARLLSGHQSGR
jgi:glycosyltransferase involved in cell wall biosynthesis